MHHQLAPNKKAHRSAGPKGETPFLRRFGGPADPLEPAVDTRVFETYPVLAIISLLWTLPCSRIAGRLPKYNLARKKTFSSEDWQHVCKRMSDEFRARGLTEIVRWINDAGRKASTRKSDQDGVAFINAVDKLTAVLAWNAFAVC